MEPQFAISRDERADGDSLIQASVQSDDTDATTIGTAVVRLVLRNQLHGANLRRTAQRAGREGVDKGLDGVGTLVKLTTDTTDKVNNVTIVLQVLIKVHLHTVTVAA